MLFFSLCFSMTEFGVLSYYEHKHANRMTVGKPARRHVYVCTSSLDASSLWIN